MRPMLATRGDSVSAMPPSGEQWWHEVKWDGIRALVVVREGHLRITSRNENAITAAYPELHGLSGALPEGTVLDGEIVAFEDGRPSFARLADRMHVRDVPRAARLAESNPVTFMAFDLLRLEGEELDDRPLVERRELLARLDLDAARVSTHVAPVYDDGVMLLEATRQQGLEGVLSKRRDSVYRFGQRTRDWLKYPHRAVGSYVVGGWRPERERARLGALLVGTPTPQGLRYRGRVGSGVAGRAVERLTELLGPLEVAESPFADEVPRVDAAGARWVEPVLVVDVAALGVTGGDRLRQPAYVGVRADLDARDLEATS